MKLDAIDKRLINMLIEDCKRPIKDLAAKLNLSIAPVHERIKKLERAGVVKRYVAILDLETIGKPLISYCNVTLKEHNNAVFIAFEDSIKNLNEILECYYVSGTSDYLMKVITADMEEYQNFVLNKLSHIEMIENIHSNFVMKPVKFKTSMKLE